MNKKRLLAVAVAGALCAPAHGVAGSRQLKLEAGHEPGTVRFLSDLHVTLGDGKKTSWVTVTRTGTFTDPRYGEFEISRQMLLAMVENFDKRVLGQDVFIDVAHRPSDGAAGKVLKLTVEGDRLRAQVEWTPFGIESVRDKGYAYLSAEYHENWQDNEGGSKKGPVLLGAALTVRPVIKRLEPVQLSEDDGAPPRLLHPELQNKLLQEHATMWKELLEALRAKLGAMKLSEAFIAQLITLAEATVGKVTDKAQATILLAAFEESGKKLAEQLAAGATGTITLKLDVPDGFKAGLTEDQVKKLMEDAAKANADAAKKLAEKRDALVKLLTETIGAATGLEDALKKELTAAVVDLVTPDMTEEQVKKLANAQIGMGNRLAVNQRLAGMGYPIAGTTHITVDDSNSVKALQETFDKRLLVKVRDADRFDRTGGKLQDQNKALAEDVLAQYDVLNARRLREEHKRLAAGDGLISDVSVPAIFERTVMREALYNLIGLQFVDTGTYPFSASAIIPYSYRDTTAAGRSGTRKYEGGAIARAGVKQASETAYPLPQKLAFEVSDELRYLTSNGQLEWDAVIENVRNASRVIGEDTEKLIFDEQLNASDQYAVTAVTNEAVATADGTNTIFVLDHFPVVRPKLVYDLQGNQVGSTLYAVTVKSNSVTRTEYDGTGTQSAGLYWSMDYNLGEVHFVDETGAPSAPTNGHAVVVSYSYTTNVYAFDTDESTDETDVHWDRFLYRYGLRKAVIEDDRYYMANFGLMSGTVRTQIEQAKQFAANFRRPGTDLLADGNLGAVKGVPNFKTTAPGLNMGDARVLIGQRQVTRYRMMKPWTMGQLQDQKNSDGRFTGKKEAYGDQFVVLHTPTQLKAALTSIVLYSSSARVDRAA